MRSPPKAERGAALLLAMVVVLMATLLVAGALTFTGHERTAATYEMRGDLLSSCAIAARNEFMSRLRLTWDPNSRSRVAMRVVFPTDVTFPDVQVGGPDSPILSTGHYASGADAGPGWVVEVDAGTTSLVLKRVVDLKPEFVGGSRKGLEDVVNDDRKRASGSRPYRIHAMCTQTDGGPQQEIEMVLFIAS